nr:GTP-binding protein GEM-like [Oncorhynchus nerka]
MESDECELYGDEVCEQTITVDGEKATVTLVDNWDSEDEGGSSQDQCIQTGDAYLLTICTAHPVYVLLCVDIFSWFCLAVE